MGEALIRDRRLGDLGVKIPKRKRNTVLNSQVIEGWSLGKTDKSNNDKIIITKRYVAVVDGVSSRNILRGTYTLSDKIVGIFDKELKTGKDFEEVLDQTNRITKKFKEENKLEQCKKDGFVCGVLDKKKGKVYIIGDVTLRLNDFVYNVVSQVDELKALYRSYLINKYLKEGYSLQEIELLDKNRKLETTLLGINKKGEENGDKNAINNLITQDIFIGCESDFGYMAITGGEHKISYKEYDVKEGDTVILASDGYPDVKGTLVETERELNKLLEEDKMCYKINKQVKGCYEGNYSYDDRTYVRIEIKE